MPVKKSTPTLPPSPKKQLKRSETDRILGGVCGGIAEYFGLDSSLVRFFFIIIILLGGSGLFIYILLWLLLPSGSDSAADTAVRISEKSNKNIWGIFLIGLGVVMLLQNFGFARLLYLDKTWPAILVVLGLIILSKDQ